MNESLAVLVAGKSLSITPIAVSENTAPTNANKPIKGSKKSRMGQPVGEY